MPNGPLTDARQSEVLDFGWEVMKYMGAPTIALWLAADGWEGGVTITASPADPEDRTQVMVSLKAWPELMITSSKHPN